MEQLYCDVSYKISKLITRTYSTSFSIAVSYLKPEKRKAIYSIYGFVRLTDEIVDSFHNYDKKLLLDKFTNDYYEAFNTGISLNPVLYSFQQVVRQYNIPDELIQAFLKSMKADLGEINYSHKDQIKKYVHGSAEAVGLMCLMVFVNGDRTLFNELKNPAMKLGSAFQKVNFLRDLKNDIELLDRNYFPEIYNKPFDENVKNEIIRDIETDFSTSYPGITKLPADAKLPVMIAYLYYRRLLKKISGTPADKLITTRIRVPDIIKAFLLIKAYLICKIKLR